MWKWLFIVLSLACLFLLVDYLISSNEPAYLKTRSPFYDLDKKEESSASFSGDGNGVQEEKDNTKLINELVSVNKARSFDSSSVGEKRRRSANLELVRASEENDSLEKPSNTVDGASALSLDLGQAESKISFIPGTPPIVFFSLDFVNEQVLEHHLQFKGVPVGGLSALSYSEENDSFVALSDDKGKEGPPRFYKLDLNKKTERGGTKYEMVLRDQVFLHNVEGQGFGPIDPEGIAFFKPDQIFVISEGAQLPHLIVPPTVFLFNSNGKRLASWQTPGMYWPEDLSQLGKWGVKENKAFEALSIDHTYDQLWIATESALHQDAQEAEDMKGKQYVRLSRFDIRRESMMDQFIYQMESDITVNNFTGSNGLTDFLYLGDEKLIVIERAYLKDNSVSGDRKTDANWVRLFLADCSKASDVSQYQELKQGRFVTCGKTQLADLSSILGNELDNIEGITIGPKISDGGYLLVLVSDNNFSPSQKTQFLYFHYLLDK